MNSISIISTLAMALGLAAALPQILQMLSTRSAAGQSVLGWGMGLVTNLSMAYVNLFGFGAKALMASNVLSGALCVIAMLLIARFGDPAERETAAEVAPSTLSFTHTRDALRPVLAPDHRGTLIEMPTTEFAALREVVMQVDVARMQRPSSVHERDLVAA